MSMAEKSASESLPADKPCDIVMEGGAASGVVYPRAVYELSRRYRFQRIGGTSAGAVAATLAAAAEYGRRRGNATSFDKLAGMPAWFAEEVEGSTRLKWLFAPEREMRPAYELFLAFVSTKGVPRVAGSLLWAGANYFPLSFFVGTLLGGLIGVLAVQGALQIGGVMLAIAAAPLAFAVAAVFAVLVLLLSFGLDVVLKLPRHHFGVARGYSSPEDEGPSPRVVNWMHDMIQKLSAKPGDQPLTFGNLQACPDEVVGNEQGIALRLMTTCLTHGRPYRLPFDDDEVLYYVPEELAQFFPSDVITWINDHPNPQAEKYVDDGFCALPKAEHLPVVVAARMSMSFPFYFSSIPLYALDRTRSPENPNRKEALSNARPERCWFADGGICSNLPVHFFDRALPRWPTFALDLREFHRDHRKSKEYAVWIDADFRDRAGRSIITEWWSVLPHEDSPVQELKFCASFARTTGFLLAVFDTMMSWRDNTQLRPIGSRDRVAHVSLSPEEGSFNLSMGDDEIRLLAKRGEKAGEKLREYFTREGWRRNRSARLVSFLTVTGEYLHCVEKACREPVKGDESYVEELRNENFRLADGVLTDGQKGVANRLLERMLDAAQDVPRDGDRNSLAGIVPPPRPTIRFLPEGEPPVTPSAGHSSSTGLGGPSAERPQA